MHPILISLFQPINKIKGVGDRRVVLFNNINCYNIRDLIFHLPFNVVDRRNSPRLSNIKNEQIITAILTVVSVVLSANRRRPSKIFCTDDSGQITLMYFNITRAYIEQNFKVGNKIAISGKVTLVDYELAMIHPDIVTHAYNVEKIKKLEPVYPATNGLSTRYIANYVREALAYLPNFEEWLEPETVIKKNWPSFKNAISILHDPKTPEDITPKSVAFTRLAFDELVANQMQLSIARTKIKKMAKAALIFNGNLAKQLKQSIKFKLTSAQLRVIKEIESDQKSTNKMFRLLQGDVGSGKTLVAFIAMLNSVEAGKQAALMAPTEILARQHYNSFSNFAVILNIKIGLLISNLKAKEKEATLISLANGDIDIVVGTHALFQEYVQFKDLSLAVVDEQHRFGVEQRLALANKNISTDFLMMSATPIPRTMAMVQYGDMEISVLDEKPLGRLKIDTKIVNTKKLNDLLARISEVIKSDQRIYWICPLIEESEKVDLANATTRFNDLQQHFPSLVGLIHGKMKADERDLILNSFANGQLKILVATTIVEVGIDVPEATIIVIENPERFGLAQLHQLRGRVGRSNLQSYCILFVKYNLSQDSLIRLSVLKESNDGFYISKKDLEIRGIGEMLGVKQSGMQNFKFFQTEHHAHLLPEAQEYACKAVEMQKCIDDKAKNTANNILLELFNYKSAFRINA